MSFEFEETLREAEKFSNHLLEEAAGHEETMAVYTTAGHPELRVAYLNQEAPEYERVRGVDPATGEEWWFFPSTLRGMEEARRRRDTKRAVRRDLRRAGITDVEIR